MFEFTDADAERWETAVDRMWIAFVAGERDAATLGALLEPDPAAREALLADLFSAAATGEGQAMWLFGRVAIAGLGGEADPDQGWMLVEQAAETWAPASTLLASWVDKGR